MSSESVMAAGGTCRPFVHTELIFASGVDERSSSIVCVGCRFPSAIH